MSKAINEPHKDLASLEKIIQSNDQQQLAIFIENLLPIEIVRELNMLAKEDQVRLLELLGPEKSAELISKISGLGSTTIVEQLPPTQSIHIVKRIL